MRAHDSCEKKRGEFVLHWAPCVKVCSERRSDKRQQEEDHLLLDELGSPWLNQWCLYGTAQVQEDQPTLPSISMSMLAPRRGPPM